MLLYAVPAYTFGKFKIAKSEHLPVLAVILLYICTPAIIINSFLKLEFSAKALLNLGIFLLLALGLQILMIGCAWMIVRKSNQKKHRVAAIATALGNCGFFGIPLLKALLPNNPEAVIYSAVFSIAMNTIAFTFGSLIISGDKKYIKVKKIFFNPAMIGAFIAMPLFIFGVKLPDIFLSALEGCVALSTPVCMFVLGIRLSTVKLLNIFTNVSAYLAICAKQLVMPLLAVAVTAVLPLDPVMEIAFIIISACPVASVVLNLSELIGEGQKNAADCVLLGTILSIATIPVIALFL